MVLIILTRYINVFRVGALNNSLVELGTIHLNQECQEKLLLFVFCKDFPFEDPVNDILTPHYDDHYFPGVNLTVHKIITMFKVHKI